MATSGKLTLLGGVHSGRHNTFNALFIPPPPPSPRRVKRARSLAGESGQLSTEENKFQLSFRRSSAEAYKIYLPTRAALFPPAPIHSAWITVLRVIVRHVHRPLSALLATYARNATRFSFAFLPTSSSSFVFFFVFPGPTDRWKVIVDAISRR